MTDFLALEELTAAHLNTHFLRVPRTVYKTADESLASSTTFQADNHLAMSFAASTNYTVEGWLALEGPTAGDFKARLAWTGTVNWVDFGLSGQALAATTAESDLKTIAQIGGTTSPSGEITLGTIVSNWTNTFISGFLSASTAGTLTLEWAQVTSNATNTIIKRGSWLRLTVAEA